jgi:hypothetical protein
MSKKETYYFSHDYNARNDRKIAALVKDFKSSGYGIFWATCEMMHEEGGELEMDDITYAAIAKDLNEEIDFVKMVIEKCIASYKLFIINELRLNSNRVERNLNKRNDISDKRRKAAFAKHVNANAEQLDASAVQNGAKEINKGNKGNKEKRGIRFSADGLKVFFDDESCQDLGLGQQQRFREGNYQPHYIIKGKIE